MMIDADIVIDRPIDEVWAFACDLRNESQWWRGVYRCDLLAGDGGLGSQYHIHAGFIGIPADEDLLVTEFQPREKFTIKAIGRFSYVCEYHLTPDPHGTLLRLLINVERWPQWASPLFGTVTRYNLKRLQRIFAH